MENNPQVPETACQFPPWRWHHRVWHNSWYGY